MYKETVKKPSTGITTNGTPANESRFDVSTKVNRICDAFLAVLQKRTETNLQNIVTANVCKTPPDLEGGLGVVAKLREQDTSLAERAAEHICFLADVNQLYDHALGMYNLDVALLIAQQSQKDPREYLPYLQSLQEMEQLRRQFTIDDNLGRRVKAIGHLYELDAVDELKAYAEKHELYSDAIALHKYKPDRLKEIMKLYARYLDSRNRFKEAGIGKRPTNPRKHRARPNIATDKIVFSQHSSTSQTTPPPRKPTARPTCGASRSRAQQRCRCRQKSSNRWPRRWPRG